MPPFHQESLLFLSKRSSINLTGMRKTYCWAGVLCFLNLLPFPLAGKCDVPIGLEDRRVPDQLITASSFYNYYCAPRNARLRQRRVGRLGGAWCAKRSDRRQWLKIDLGGLTRVSRIATQGRQNADQWVTSYYVSYSTKVYRFITYKENRRTKVSER